MPGIPHPGKLQKPCRGVTLEDLLNPFPVGPSGETVDRFQNWQIWLAFTVMINAMPSANRYLVVSPVAGKFVEICTYKTGLTNTCLSGHKKYLSVSCFGLMEVFIQLS